jgi:hypothetical protein
MQALRTSAETAAEASPGIATSSKRNNAASFSAWFMGDFPFRLEKKHMPLPDEGACQQESGR